MDEKVKTLYVKPEQADKKWYIIDATDKVLGRLAEKIAVYLRGKHKACFQPSADNGDFIIVINSDKVKFTGKKNIQKNYYWHTNYPGGIKDIRLDKLMEKDSRQVIIKAVKGMLPRNRLGRKILKNLKVYTDEKHPHKAQMPVELEL
jgi:large subunit ribosomal protein L13